MLRAIIGALVVLAFCVEVQAGGLLPFRRNVRSQLAPRAVVVPAQVVVPQQLIVPQQQRLIIPSRQQLIIVQ